MLRNKAFTALNIAGLASGLACFILIGLYVTHELSYDRYNEKAGRIYQVNSSIRFWRYRSKPRGSQRSHGAALKNDYPTVEEYVRFYNSQGSKLIKKRQ